MHSVPTSERTAKPLEQHGYQDCSRVEPGAMFSTVPPAQMRLRQEVPVQLAARLPHAPKKSGPVPSLVSQGSGLAESDQAHDMRCQRRHLSRSFTPSRWTSTPHPFPPSSGQPYFAHRAAPPGRLAQRLGLYQSNRQAETSTRP